MLDNKEWNRVRSVRDLFPRYSRSRRSKGSLLLDHSVATDNINIIINDMLNARKVCAVHQGNRIAL